jgi:hypothetical protein
VIERAALGVGIQIVAPAPRIAVMSAAALPL